MLVTGITFSKLEKLRLPTSIPLAVTRPIRRYKITDYLYFSLKCSLRFLFIYLVYNFLCKSGKYNINVQILFHLSLLILLDVFFYSASEFRKLKKLHYVLDTGQRCI